MRNTEYRFYGYVSLIVYLIVVFVGVFSLYRTVAPDWHLLDWLVVLFVVGFLIPGVPGLLLIFPAHFLDSSLAFLCQVSGILGIIVTFAWGFVFSPQWWVLTIAALALNWSVHQYKKQLPYRG